jgi:hypothetical protein
MIKPASFLRETSRNKKAINMQVKEILDTMQTKMVEANKEGRNSIEFPVPKQFVQFPNDNDSELLIIATVLRELKAQDYKVEILDIGHSLLFEIRWLADISDIDREKMKQLLREHMVRQPTQATPKDRRPADGKASAASLQGIKSNVYRAASVVNADGSDDDEDD